MCTGQTGPQGMLGEIGPVACCPSCGGIKIRWDAKSDMSSCDSCGWMNLAVVENNRRKRIENGGVGIPPDGPRGCGQDEPGERGDRMPLEVDILGTAYTVRRVSGSDDPRMNDSDGFCDETTKEIFAETYEDNQGAPNSKKDLAVQSKKVVRHEIVHAFLVESGLAECSAWAQDEEAVDWFARQGQKIIRAWIQAEAM